MHYSTGRYKILIHLKNQGLLSNESLVDERAPYSLCQDGIAKAVNLSIYRTSKLLRELAKEGLIKVDSSHIKGSKRKRKVYSLTPKGENKAKNIIEKLEETKVTVKTKSNRSKIKLKHIDSHIHSKNPLLFTLNNIKENNVINLNEFEEKPEEIFSGRRDELQFLKKRLEKVNKNDFCSSAILIKGKAGIGKTKLVNEFKDYAISEGFDFLTGKGHYNISEPYLPFKEAFDKFQKSNNTDPMKFTYTKEKKKDWRDENEVKTIRNLILSETTENIKSLAEEYPMVIFIDDLQWVDKASLKLIHYLTEKLENAPLLLIVAYRSENVDHNDFLNEVLQRMNRQDLYDELELNPLIWEDTREIVQRLIGRIDVPKNFIEIIHKTSEGNPLFLKELVIQMLDDGTVDPKGNKYPLETDKIDLPEVVDDIIGRRIKNLDEENLRILKMGSIIGEEVRFELLDFVTDIDTLNLLEYVDILTETGLWDNEPGKDVFYFTHGLIQHSVYKSIPGHLRKELHKRVGDSIEELFEDDIEGHYSDLGFHYKRAEDFSKGIEYYLKAGEKAEGIYAHEDAMEMYKEALKLAEKGDLDEKRKWKILENLGDVNKIIGKHDISLEYYEKIPKKKIKPKYKQRIYRKIANVYERKGEFNKAIETVKKGLKERSNENMETSRLLSRKGFSKMRQGKYDQAKEDFLKALNICENINSDREYANINQGLGTVYSYQGKFNKAISHLETALERWKKIGNLEGESYSLNNLGSVYLKKGDLNSALKYYEQSLESRKKIGDKRNISACLNNIGITYFKKGELEESIEYYQRCRKMWEEIGDQQGIAAILINIGKYYLKKRDLDTALEKLKKSLEISEEINYIEGIAASLNNLGEIFLLKGELDEATKKYQRGLKLSKEIGCLQIIPHLLNGLAKINILEDDFQKAVERGKKGLKISKNIDAKVEKGIINRVLGMAYRAKGERTKAKEEFEKGKEILKDTGEKKELAELFFQYALLWEDMEECEKKEKYINKSLSMFEEMGIEPWIEKCENELEE